MLCGTGYTPEQIKTISGHDNNCLENLNSKTLPKDLNYPSMITSAGRANFARTVTNVGIANLTYKAIITSPSNLRISVTPETLSFSFLHEKQSFVVETDARASKNNYVISGSLVWYDGIHTVRSSIVVHLKGNATGI
ncbi:hypothetical protein IFM89_024181 [Coptis chinensis]|uniref:Subtilisin-like protease fibronectin type-III domain-containing protein n=1 Tax=Coptis chinensis TaxID=261450 RepID=A0A835HAT2_9MAGN|nr:hypothetical protein IFM89_024181 [Coptis chinensis]